MAVFILKRRTIYQIPKNLTLGEAKAQIPDSGRRRHLCFGFDFDSRSLSLRTMANGGWVPLCKERWTSEQEEIKRRLESEFGEHSIDAKIKNFVAIDTKPMSVLAYHNDFFEQVRNAFVMGQYYPALVGACALGERILNHLVLDLRGFFSNTPEYKSVSRKDSFANWDVPINALEAWGMLLPTAVSEFRKLKLLRHRSVHFNVSTYQTLRADALSAILHMRAIIEAQFGTFGRQPWFISGTKGHAFIRKDYEYHPFVVTYFVPRFSFVGPLFGMRFDGNVWDVMDVPDYGDGAWTDEEFARQYNERDSSMVLQEPPHMEWAPDVTL